MTTDLYCRTCGKFLNPEGMSQITEWHNRKNSVALFLDKKTGTCHEFLNERDSEAKRQPSKIEPTSIIIQKQPEEQTPPTPPEPTPEVELAAPEAVKPEQVEPEQSVEIESDDWFDAYVFSVHPGYCFAKLSNDETVFVPVRVITNLPNQHECALNGATLQLRIVKNPKPTAPWCALEAVLTAEFEVMQEESGTILWWKRDLKYGMVERHACGCRIFVSDSDNIIPFEAGDDVVIWRFKPSYHPNNPGVVASRIRRWRDTDNNNSASPDSGESDEVVIRF